jgi:surface polysaccharide O-acyltransferase-like enzyme
MNNKKWAILLVLSIILLVIGLVLTFYSSSDVTRVVPVPTRDTFYPYRVPGIITSIIGVLILAISSTNLVRNREKR